MSKTNKRKYDRGLDKDATIAFMNVMTEKIG